MKTFDSPYFRLSAALAVVALLFGFFVATPTAPRVTTVPAVEVEVAKDRDVFKVVEQMPLFPGADCGDLEDYADRKPCAERALLDYVYDHVKYPKEARDRGKQGMAVVRFVIEPHGVMSDIRLVRDPGAGLGEAALKVVGKMKNDNTRWEPGLQKGKPVPVEFNLPIRFKLE
ncbi:energy transducer TonB [Lewinella sp. IMCC34183]|uniref:energy transducer TonB n=1 Tax=Lewinella sp. IMCC34183 TaxID=2248762 RepID=UPI000E279C25|nr:energy transducer TonB [Lewinella sp. IMCC34183]